MPFHNLGGIYSSSNLMCSDGGLLISMWYGPISSIPEGWVYCNGDNSTPDLRGIFPRGATTDDQVTGTTVSGTTKLPVAGFSTNTDTHRHSTIITTATTDSDTHYHTTTATTISTTSDTHTHTVDGDSAEGVTSGGSSSGDAVLNNTDGSYDHDFSTSSDTHSHTAVVPALTTSSDSHSHTLTIPSVYTGFDGHNHTVTGGDDETAPDHCFLYFIAYIG